MADAINARDPRKLGLLTIPGVVVSLLPSLACPLCWPAYAALVSSLGLGFLVSSTYLLPLTGALLAVAVVGLGWQIKSKGYGPFVLGLLSAAIILPGKFLLESNAITYAGAAILVIASVWSLAPSRSAGSASCRVGPPRQAAAGLHLAPSRSAGSASCPTCPPAGEGSRESV